MKYFAQYDENGHYISFYTTNIWKEEDLPMENCIEITKDQWSEGLSKKCGYIDGKHTVIIKPQQEIEEAILSSIRIKRNFLLKQSDWTQFSDSPLTPEKKTEWALYRQALRDLPENVNINNVVFPTEPQ